MLLILNKNVYTHTYIGIDITELYSFIQKTFSENNYFIGSIKKALTYFYFTLFF